ncbi:MAG TPA: DUF441 domain-containing protein [Clostridia bacterium]|nr:DUF441 domain-containing protein [Clostridia bacterium]
MQLQFANLIILAVLAVAVLGHNHTVALAAALVLVINLAGLGQVVLPFLEARGLEIGIVILTAAILAPLAAGKIDSQQVISTLTNVRTVLAVGVGVLVAFLGGKGVDLLTIEPQLITGVVFGTILGVAFFKGVPVGPLICSGILYYIFKLFKI